jgi:hypothetical protein
LRAREACLILLAVPSTALTTAPPLLPSLPPAAVLAGCWSASERLLALNDIALVVNVWFHFFEGGEAILSLRTKDKPPSRVHGRWWVELGTLVVSFGGSTIRSDYALKDDLLQWAGETLLRLSDSTASIAFGIQLPYHLGHLSILEPPAA